MPYTHRILRRWDATLPPPDARPCAVGLWVDASGWRNVFVLVDRRFLAELTAAELEAGPPFGMGHPDMPHVKPTAGASAPQATVWPRFGDAPEGMIEITKPGDKNRAFAPIMSPDGQRAIEALAERSRLERAAEAATQAPDATAQAPAQAAPAAETTSAPTQEAHAAQRAPRAAQGQARRLPE